MTLVNELIQGIVDLIAWEKELEAKASEDKDAALRAAAAAAKDGSAAAAEAAASAASAAAHLAAAKLAICVNAPARTATPNISRASIQP